MAALSRLIYAICRFVAAIGYQSRAHLLHYIVCLRRHGYCCCHFRAILLLQVVDGDIFIVIIMVCCLSIRTIVYA